MPRKPDAEDVFQATGLDPRRTWSDNTDVKIICTICKKRVPMSESRQFIGPDRSILRTCVQGNKPHKKE